MNQSCAVLVVTSSGGLAWQAGGSFENCDREARAIRALGFDALVVTADVGRDADGVWNTDLALARKARAAAETDKLYRELAPHYR